jgi:transcriptional regulator CtsR
MTSQQKQVKDRLTFCKEVTEMKMSDIVAKYIIEMLDEKDGNAEIQRNELAGLLGCVPSQINYVISSRFTPEQGYIVESRRGGGGYIRITRITTDPRIAIMHIVNSIGNSISAQSANTILENMAQRGMLDSYEKLLIMSALSDTAYKAVPQEYRDALRASVMKNMLAAILVR